VVGPVADGATQDFIVEVTVPNDGNCYEADLATLMAETQSAIYLTDTAVIETSIMPSGPGVVDGYVYDANTALGIENAYVYLELGDEEYETHADANGYYNIAGVPGCTYEGQYQAVGYFGQFQVPVSITGGMTTTLDVSLDASMPALSENAVSVDVAVDSTDTYNLNLANNGTGDLNFHVTEVSIDSIYPVPAPVQRVALPSGIDPQVYADLDAAADGTGSFIVYLADQADLSAAYAIKDWSARGQYVLNALQATAERSQAALRADLDRAGTAYESRYIVNALVVEGDITLAENLINRAEVAYIGPNAKIEAPEPVEMSPALEAPEALAWGIEKVRADEVWSDFGAMGAGIVIANIDTGVDYNHPALEQQYRGTLGGGSYDHNYNWWDPYGYGPLVPYDWHNHGSHTMGTMLGSDNPTNPISATEAIGMAPQANWFACEGFDQNTGYGYNAELLECAEFLLAPWDLTGANPDPNLRADVINNSWGGGQAQWWYNQAIYAWRAAGIIGIFSAGNEGPACYTAGDPGDMENILSVGATSNSDAIASFSSRGPANVTELTKPNVSAPGVNIYSAYRDGTYGLMGGTSMAAPHVSGEAALLWSAVPELRGDVQLTYWLIEQSAFGLTTSEGCGGDGLTDIPNNTFGWGRIDAYEAVSLALSSDWDIAWLDVNPASGEVMPSGAISIELGFDSTGLTLGECYSGTLKVEYNDPYITEEFVPVEMCVVEAMQRIYLPIVLKND
jgi:subtilisin family serine protease